MPRRSSPAPTATAAPVRSPGYHPYVFDTGRRKFVGRFEEMYQGEEAGGYDSWYQEDITGLPKQLSLTILGRHNFGKILDVGCGKGTFTHLLKKENNRVVGVDVSATAIARARVKYPSVTFRSMSVAALMDRRERYDLVVAMEVLSYLTEWRQFIRYAARVSRHLYLTLYLPPNPIGFVKSFPELEAEVERAFTPVARCLVTAEEGDHLLLLGKRS